MCTVVFIPVKDKYLFASLRDENPMRKKALVPSITYADHHKYLSPVDPLGGGTWAGVNEHGNVIILLNGAFQNHVKKDKYARSRGEIVKELLSDDLPVIGWAMMNLENVEPFTLIIWTDERLFQLIWDGHQKHRINLAKDIPHIFSSATLYEKNIRDTRKLFFEQWINSGPLITGFSLFDFFKTSYCSKQNGFIMNRNDQIKTLSYSFIEVSVEKKATFHYDEFSSGKFHVSEIALLTKEHSCMCPVN